MAIHHNAGCPHCHASHENHDVWAEYPIAMAYVPWQHLESVYEPDCALKNGTIFPELNKPFLGKRGCR